MLPARGNSHRLPEPTDFPLPTSATPEEMFSTLPLSRIAPTRVRLDPFPPILQGRPNHACLPTRRLSPQPLSGRQLEPGFDNMKDRQLLHLNLISLFLGSLLGGIAFEEGRPNPPRSQSTPGTAAPPRRPPATSIAIYSPTVIS